MYATDNGRSCPQRTDLLSFRIHRMNNPVHFRTLLAAALASAAAVVHAAVPFTASSRLTSKADAWVLQQLATTTAAPVLVQMPT